MMRTWKVPAVVLLKGGNEASRAIGSCEDLKKTSLDPYVAVRDHSVQNRAKKVRE